LPIDNLFTSKKKYIFCLRADIQLNFLPISTLLIAPEGIEIS